MYGLDVDCHCPRGCGSLLSYYCLVGVLVESLFVSGFAVVVVVVVDVDVLDARAAVVGLVRLTVKLTVYVALFAAAVACVGAVQRQVDAADGLRLQPCGYCRRRILLGLV